MRQIGLTLTLTLTLTLALFAAASPAVAAGRTLADAAQVLLQEATIREEELAAGLIRSTKEARLLRRGKKNLSKGILLHNKGSAKQAASMLDRGVFTLLRTLLDADKESYDEEAEIFSAAEAVLSEIDEYAFERVAGLRARADGLPETKLKTRALEFLVDAEGQHSLFQAAPSPRHGGYRAALVYELVAKAEKKIAKAEKRVKEGLDNVASHIPKDLPKSMYELLITVDGSDPIPITTTSKLSSKQVRKSMTRLIKLSAEAYQASTGCAASTFGTPWTGIRFTVGVDLACPDVGGGTTTRRLVYTVERKP